MNNYQTYEISPSFSFKLASSGEGVALSDVASREVESVWREEKRQLGEHLFNGKVLSVVERGSDGLKAIFVEYKVFLAFVRKAELRKELRIKPLSLSCLTFCTRDSSEAVLIGQRSKTVMQYPLCYELAPSGGIDPEALIEDRVDGDRVDVVEQALRELAEETPLTKADVAKISPFALVFDSESGFYEVCVEIEITHTASQRNLVPSPEYDSLEWIKKEDLPHFINNHRFVPLSLHLLKFRKFL